MTEQSVISEGQKQRVVVGRPVSGAETKAPLEGGDWSWSRKKKSELGVLIVRFPLMETSVFLVTLYNPFILSLVS